MAVQGAAACPVAHSPAGRLRSRHPHSRGVHDRPRTLDHPEELPAESRRTGRSGRLQHGARRRVRGSAGAERSRERPDAARGGCIRSRGRPERRRDGGIPPGTGSDRLLEGRVLGGSHRVLRRRQHPAPAAPVELQPAVPRHPVHGILAEADQLPVVVQPP